MYKIIFKKYWILWLISLLILIIPVLIAQVNFVRDDKFLNKEYIHIWNIPHLIYKSPFWTILFVNIVSFPLIINLIKNDLYFKIKSNAMKNNLSRNVYIAFPFFLFSFICNFLFLLIELLANVNHFNLLIGQFFFQLYFYLILNLILILFGFMIIKFSKNLKQTVSFSIFLMILFLILPGGFIPTIHHSKWLAPLETRLSTILFPTVSFNALMDYSNSNLLGTLLFSSYQENLNKLSYFQIDLVDLRIMKNFLIVEIILEIIILHLYTAIFLFILIKVNVLNKSELSFSKHYKKNKVLRKL